MAMNSSEQYAILNSDNFLQILNEDIPEGLKLFMSEMVKAPEMMNSNDEQSKEKQVDRCRSGQRIQRGSTKKNSQQQS